MYAECRYKRDPTHRGILTSIGIPRMAKIPSLYRDWLRSLNLEKS